MELNEYAYKAQRTSTTLTLSDALENGLLGLAGEAGELCDLYKKYLYQGHELDKEHLVRELGDVLWYVAETAKGLGTTLEAVAQTNLDKLDKRYPNGFDPSRSKNRKKDDL